MSNRLLTESEINENTILGKDISQVDWKEGIREFPIRMDNFTLIPWVLPHWLGEKHIRKKEIEELAGSKDFMEKALLIFNHSKKGHEISDEAAGIEVLQYIDLKSSKITNALIHDPKNSQLRSQLVNTTLDHLVKKTTPSLQQYRGLFLQALMANCFGEVSTDSLLTLKGIQDRYYLHAQSMCRVRIEQNYPAPNDSLDKKKGKKKIIIFSIAHLNIFTSDKKYMQSKLRSVLEKAKSKKFVLRLQDFGNESEAIEDKKIRQTLLMTTWEAVKIMRCFPLLHEEAHEFVKRLNQIEPNNPFAMFLHGFIDVAEADLMIMAFRRGFKPKKRLEKIQNILRTVMQSYEKAASLVKDDFGVLTLNIILEYTNAILFLHNLGMLGQSIPRDVLKRYVTNSNSLLIRAQENGDSPVLDHSIAKIKHVAEQNGFKL